jgi:uncharacterized short protein YbdD (DUF466 family)
MGEKIREFMRLVTSTARLMVGVPDYDKYVAHCQATHPDRPVMTYKEFFRNRQEARYKSGVRGCC